MKLTIKTYKVDDFKILNDITKNMFELELELLQLFDKAVKMEVTDDFCWFILNRFIDTLLLEQFYREIALFNKVDSTMLLNVLLNYKTIILAEFNYDKPEVVVAVIKRLEAWHLAIKRINKKVSKK